MLSPLRKRKRCTKIEIIGQLLGLNGHRGRVVIKCQKKQSFMDGSIVNLQNQGISLEHVAFGPKISPKINFRHTRSINLLHTLKMETTRTFLVS